MKLFHSTCFARKDLVAFVAKVLIIVFTVTIFRLTELIIIVVVTVITSRKFHLLRLLTLSI